jgi:hypothetical protein
MKYSVGSIFKEYEKDFFKKYGSRMTVQQKKAYYAISRCQTEDLGSTVYQCRSCLKTHESNSSCGNRHCPLCQGNKTIDWVQAQLKKVLPVPYFLLTFTIPSEIREYIYKNQKIAYSIMLEASSETIKKLLLDKRYIGADLLGFTSILHTWGGMLQFHPHIHVLIPCGGINKQNGDWVDGRADFIFPVEAASKIWRAKLINAFKKKIGLKGIKCRMMDKNFIVHAKPAGTGVNAMKYLARYVFRVAIDNSRVIKVKDGNVYFKYRSKTNGKSKLRHLGVIEFIRRFIQHILPCGFMKIRHYGFLHTNSSVSIDHVKFKICIMLDIIINELSEIRKLKPKIPICKKCKIEMLILKTRSPIKRISFNNTG